MTKPAWPPAQLSLICGIVMLFNENLRLTGAMLIGVSGGWWMRSSREDDG